MINYLFEKYWNLNVTNTFGGTTLYRCKVLEEDEWCLHILDAKLNRYIVNKRDIATTSKPITETDYNNAVVKMANGKTNA